MKKINLLYIIPLLLLAACKPNIDEFVPSKGNADFTRYAAVGDSWTAGMADASLYKSGQENSYPNILSNQFKIVGGGEFKQPLMVDDIGFGLGTGTPKPKMAMGYHADCKNVIGLVPAYVDAEVNLANFASVAANGPFNNISTPGLKSFYMAVPGMAALNPYYGRFASGANNTVLDEIPLVNATFFTLWLGSYDVLSYAISGGTDPLTSIEMFTGSLQGTLATLTANGAKGAVATIPYVLDAPFFHTIPYNALPLDQASADMLNAAYAPLNMLIKSMGSTDTLHFAAGQNPLVIRDASLAWGMRQAKSSDLVLLSLPQDSLKCGGWGSQKPVPANFILDSDEIYNIGQAAGNYSTAIANLVSASNGNVVLVDMYAKLNGLQEGLVFDNVNLNNKFVTGNFYSTDGLNPTPMGSALVAYYFIEAINEGFGANIPQVIVSDYPGVTLP
jgi:hypothetical protein